VAAAASAAWRAWRHISGGAHGGKIMKTAIGGIIARQRNEKGERRKMAWLAWNDNGK